MRSWEECTQAKREKDIDGIFSSVLSKVWVTSVACVALKVSLLISSTAIPFLSMLLEAATVSSALTVIQGQAKMTRARKPHH